MKKGVRGFTGPTDDEARLKRDKLVDEMKSLTAEIEKLRKLQQDARQGATIQQQSFDGSGPFAGLIQNALTGGMVASGNAARGLASPWGGTGGRFPALRSPSAGMRATRQASTGEGTVFNNDPMLDLIMRSEGTTREGRLLLPLQA